MKIKEKFDAFIENIKNKGLKVFETLVFNDGAIYEHYFSNDKDKLREVYSISKTVTGLCTMKAIELGLLTLETPIMNFFSDVEIYNKNNISLLKELKIKHLLTLTLGQEQTLVSENWIKETADINESYVSAVLNYKIEYTPGTSFFYTNAGNYLLCVIIQKITGKKFSEFANQYIFTPLQISDCAWRESKDGICLGATGLSLKLHDLLKIGQLLLDDGKFNGKEIIETELIKDMKKERISEKMIRRTHSYISPIFPKNGYGLNVWLTGDGNYFADGKSGQFLIIMPKQKRIIITLSETKNSSEMREIINCMEVLK